MKRSAALISVENTISFSEISCCQDFWAFFGNNEELEELEELKWQKNC
jgi:hypothetical protein